MKHFGITCIFLIISFNASTAQADYINIHISDCGIEQYWDSSMKIGADFIISSNPKSSHNQIHSDMHDMVRELLGVNAKSQILIPMPEDSTMNSGQNIEEIIYQKLQTTVRQAIAGGNRDFEFQLVQHIKTGGYADPRRQDMVTDFSKAAYGAIARITNELRQEHTCTLDATVGSNGTVAIGRAVEKLRSISDLFTTLDFVDGRASYEEMNDVIEVFGASRINLSNTQGDWWGHSPIMTGNQASISNHDTCKRLLRENPMMNYEWIVPLDAGVDAHVLRMTKQDAKFKVRRFYVNENHEFETYDVPVPMTGRDIKQLWGASDLYSQIKQRPVSLVIADRIRKLENGYTAARYVASKIPRNSKVVILDSHSDNNPMKYLISAKVTPENLVSLSRKGSDADLFKELRQLNADFVITFDNEAPSFDLPNTLYVVGKNTFNAVREMTELYADLLKNFQMLSSGEKKTVAALEWTGHLEKIVKAIERDQKKGISGGTLEIISSDTLYEVTKIFTNESFKRFAKVLEKAPNPKKNEGLLLTKTRELVGKPVKAVNVHALSSIMDASFVIADAIREGRVPFSGNCIDQIDDIQDFAKAGVGGLSYALGFLMSGGNTVVAGGCEIIGKAAADLTEHVSLKAFTDMVTSEKGYSENVQQLLTFWKQQQQRRIEKGEDIQRAEDYFGKKNLHAMGLSSKDIQNLNNSVVQKAFQISGVLKKYSVHRYQDAYGCDVNVQRMVYETPNGNGTKTKTIRTSIVRRQHRNGQEENKQIYHAMSSERAIPHPKASEAEKMGGVSIDPKLQYGGKVENKFIKRPLDDRPKESSRSWQTVIPEGIE